MFDTRGVRQRIRHFSFYLLYAIRLQNFLSYVYFHLVTKLIRFLFGFLFANDHSFITQIDPMRNTFICLFFLWLTCFLYLFFLFAWRVIFFHLLMQSFTHSFIRLLRINIHMDINKHCVEAGSITVSQPTSDVSMIKIFPHSFFITLLSLLIDWFICLFIALIFLNISRSFFLKSLFFIS